MLSVIGNYLGVTTDKAKFLWDRPWKQAMGKFSQWVILGAEFILLILVFNKCNKIKIVSKK